MGNLIGKRIAVTRAQERADSWVAELRAQGADVLVCPIIAYAPPEDTRPLDAALRNLARYHWLMVTSAAAVDVLAVRRAFPLPVHIRVAAVGKATAAALAVYGIHADLLPEQPNADGLLAELGDLAGQHVLLPGSDIARDTLAAGLRARGAAADVVVAYRTIPGSGVHDLLESLRARALDAIIFSSPSIVHYLLDGLEYLNIQRTAAHELLRQVALVAIGPTTAQAMVGEGLALAAQAPTPTIAGVIAALTDVFHHGKRIPAGATGDEH